MVGITNKIMLAEIRRQQQLSQSIVDGQTSISTGITLNKPSDDALAWVQVSDIGRAHAQQAAWQANVSYGTTRAATAESNLSEINSLLPRAQELVTSARNGSLNDTSRAAIVEEVQAESRSLREYLSAQMKALLATPAFLDALPRYLLPDAASQARIGTVIQRLKAIVAAAGEA